MAKPIAPDVTEILLEKIKKNKLEKTGMQEELTSLAPYLLIACILTGIFIGWFFSRKKPDDR